MKRLLSICGGGMRGIQPAVYIEALEHISGKPARDQFDLITGTSTGGLIALALTVPNVPATGTALVEMYHKQGPSIFDRPWYRKFSTVGGAFGPKYDNVGLQKVVTSLIGTDSMGLARPRCMVPAYSLSARGPAFFKSWDSACPPALAAAMATSAAPTYFPAYEGYVDGGLAANDPTVCGIVELMTLEKVPASQIAVLSLGTGTEDKPISEKQWGLAGWAPAIVDCLMSGSQETTHYQAEHLGLGAYLRLNTTLGSNPEASMDDASPATLRALESAARRVVMLKTQALLEWLDKSAT